MGMLHRAGMHMVGVDACLDVACRGLQSRLTDQDALYPRCGV